jgi:protection-of-telomeres protein 1
MTVKCNHQDKPPTPLTTILNSVPRILQQSTGLEYTLPFTNEKYRCNVRVIDYFPHKLEDFAVGRRTSEYEVLSDYSGGESTDNGEDMRLFRRGKGFGGEKTWEWRFALKVVDADKKSSPKTEKTEEFAWLVVDNPAAQMLLNMDAVK